MDDPTRIPNTPAITAQLDLRAETAALLDAVRRVTAIALDRRPDRDRVRAALDAGRLQLRVALDDATGLVVVEARPTGTAHPYRPLAVVHADPADPRFGLTPDDAWRAGADDWPAH
jgi:hypothetical protein